MSDNTRSVHDNVINSYEVFCNRREVIFKTEYPHEPRELTNVVFTGVVAYDFKHDTDFGSIIFGFEPASPMAIYDENKQLMEAGAPYCWPGPWAHDRSQAEMYFTEHGTKGWYLCATLGLCGWILANSMEVVAVE
jgi:hypothetical protein